MAAPTPAPVSRPAKPQSELAAHGPQAPDTAPASPAPPTTPQRHTSAAAGRSRGEPSLRAPYAPGQRVPRGPRQPAPPDERQSLELELTAATYEEFVVTTRPGEMDHDQGNGPESSAAERAEAFEPPARMDELPATQRHNSHSRDAGRRNGHTREREEHAYSPAYQSAGFEREREGDRADLEAESLDAEDRESPDAPPRGDVRGEVGPLIDDLKALFQRDRATASANGGTRCGICYLHYALDELEYRDDEGYYVCPACARTLGAARLPMVRRQKHA